MEAALVAYDQEKPEEETILDRLEIGATLLDEVARLEKRPSDAIRWWWVIGQGALADGAFSVAGHLLFRGCDQYPGQATLIIACAILHESNATFKADAHDALRGVSGTTSTGIGRDPAILGIMRFRRERRDSLERARNGFEEVLELEPSSTEAALRLGYVRLLEAKADAAAELLEPLVRSRVDARTAFLARLFLGRAREQQKRVDEAIRLFREAMSILPAQSARLALASRLHVSGDAAAAVGLVEQVTADTRIEDPWWGYRFGQYWLVDPVLETLRAEARQ
jgi:tetratricopeptide (TPR) repeat protein